MPPEATAGSCHSSPVDSQPVAQCRCKRSVLPRAFFWRKRVDFLGRFFHVFCCCPIYPQTISRRGEIRPIFFVGFSDFTCPGFSFLKVRASREILRRKLEHARKAPPGGTALATTARFCVRFLDVDDSPDVPGPDLWAQCLTSRHHANEPHNNLSHSIAHSHKHDVTLTHAKQTWSTFRRTSCRARLSGLS